jgi:hypothetical protein
MASIVNDSEIPELLFFSSWSLGTIVPLVRVWVSNTASLNWMVIECTR